MLELRKRDNLQPRAILFSTDGNSAVVLWKDKAETEVIIIDLPSGQERRRIKLSPDRRWSYVTQWDGRFLWCEYTLKHPERPSDSGWYLRRTARFDTQQEPIGGGVEEPLLAGEVRSADGQTFWDEGADWVAYYSFVRPGQITNSNWITEAQNWIVKKLNLKTPKYRTLVAVNVVNRPSGSRRYRLPFPVGYPATVSKDGSRLACGTDEGGIAMYNHNPPARWPWVVLAGVGPVLIVFLLERWRSRRRAAHITLPQE